MRAVNGTTSLMDARNLKSPIRPCCHDKSRSRSSNRAAATRRTCSSCPFASSGLKSNALPSYFAVSLSPDSHKIFDLQNLQKPKPMAFPFFARNGGFGATELPGVITWKKEAGVFEAEIGSDIACSGRTRHTYRLSSAEGLHGITFVIVRIQVKKDECRSEWLTIWEASPWPPWSERFP